jgi:RHS repeat-associated protein
MRSSSWIAALLTSLFTTVSWAQSSPSAFTTGNRYDAARQLVGTIHPTAGGGYEAARSTYDADGRVVKVERGYLAQWQSEAILPVNWPQFTILEVIDKTYDSVGHLLTEKRSSNTGANPVLTQMSYDAAGRRDCQAIRMNPSVYGSLPASACSLTTQGADGLDRITHTVYDAAAEILNEQRAYGTSSQQNYSTYAYTPNGQHDWAEDAKGNRTDYTYDGFDRLTQINFPSTTVGAHAPSSSDYEHYGYDENGNRTSLRLRSGETINYSIDALNRVYFKTFPSASGGTYYAFDLQGHSLDARFGSLTGLGVHNDFDGFGRHNSTTSISASGSLQLSYLYDEDGNRTRVTYPDSNYVQYTYDGLDRLDQVRENGASSGPGLLADYSYDMLGRRTNVARGNGTMTTYYYDGISRPSSIVQDLASTADDVTFGLGYNAASQVTLRSVSNDSYSYFSLPQSKSYTPDGLNRYASVAGTAYGYDGRGNLTSDGSRNFTYDLENHLLTVSGSASLNLSYDPLGRLLTTASGSNTTLYVYDGDRLAAEYNGSTVLRRYVNGAGEDEPLVWYEGSGLSDRRWLHTDHQGSVVSTSDGAGQGTLYAYGAYGEPAYDNWGGSRFRYTGQIMLPEAKLYHYKARVYDPLLGRFLQTDPLGYSDDLNLYAYTYNDSLNRTDPSGEDAYVQVWDNGTVHIQIPIVFSGDAASPQNIQIISNNISSTLSGKFGKYTVTSTVQVLTNEQSKTAPLFNTGEITSGPAAPFSVDKGHSYVKSGAEMHITMKDVNGVPIPTGKPNQTSTSAKGKNTPAHEGGHLLGLDDKAGDNGNLMDEGAGTQLGEDDIQTIIGSPHNAVDHCQPVASGGPQPADCNP